MAKNGPSWNYYRSVKVTMPVELAEMLHKWMAANDIRKPEDAIQLLVYMQLSASGKDGIDQWQMQTSFNEIRTWLLGEVAKHMTEITKQIDESVRLARATAPLPPVPYPPEALPR